MKKSNRFISFVCSLAMAASTFSGVLVASAEETNEISQGVVLEYVEAESSATTAVVDINAVGFDSLKSFTVNLASETEGVTISEATYESHNQGFQVTTNVDTEGVYRMVASINTAEEPSVKEDTLLGTVTLTFVNPITESAIIGLVTGSLLSGTANGESAKIVYNSEDSSVSTMPVSKVTVTGSPVTTEPAVSEPAVSEPAVSEAPSASPEATPYPVVRPTARPTATPAETAEPIVTAEPVEQGVSLVYDEEKSTSATAVIDVHAVGFDSLKSFTINMMPATDNVTITSATYTPNNQGFQTTTNVDNEGVYRMVASINTADEPSVAEDTLLGSVALTFASPLTSNAIIELATGSLLSGTANGESAKIIYDGTDSTTMPATFVTVLANPNAPTESEEPTESPAPFEGGEIALGDLITNAPASDETYGILVALDVKVTKNNGDEAVYGDDFVAVYDDKELTEDEYFNLINGYGGVSIADVISGLSFVVKDGTSVYAAPAYQPEDDTTGNMTVLPEYGGEQTYAPQSSEEPEDGMVTLTVDTPSRGAILVTYTDADGNSVSLDTDDEDIKEEIPAGTSVRLRAVADSGYEFSRWGGDISGTSSPKTITVKKDTDVSATFTKTGSSSSSSGSNSGTTGSNTGAGSGSIARPNGGSGVISTGINFTDLGSVQWAQPAINYLVSAGIINGRSNTIFDPNASVTRAEFAKMVCATFGISATPNAAQTFVDVSPSDWFYGYVQAAAANGIVNGVSETAFDPNATITREQMAAMLYRAIEATGNLAKLPAGTATVFADEAQIADYAKIYVSALNAAGVINGTSATTFEPKATATRAQAAAIIYQFLKAVGTV